METLGIGTEGVVPKPRRARAEEARHPAQAAVAGEELRVKFPGEEVKETSRIELTTRLSPGRDMHIHSGPPHSVEQIRYVP